MNMYRVSATLELEMNVLSCRLAVFHSMLLTVIESANTRYGIIYHRNSVLLAF